MPEYGCGRTEGPAGWRGWQLGGLPRYGEGRAGRVAALLLRGVGSRGGVAPGAEGVGGEGRGEGAGGGAQREASHRGHAAAAAAAAHRAKLVVASLQTAAMVTWKNVELQTIHWFLQRRPLLEAFPSFTFKTLNVRALVGAFNQEKALVEAFSVIVKTNISLQL